MNWKSAWSRRTFLSALGAATGSALSPSQLRASALPAAGTPITKNHGVDGNPICEITSGLGSTGDIYAELGVTPSSTSSAPLPSSAAPS